MADFEVAGAFRAAFAFWGRRTVQVLGPLALYAGGGVAVALGKTGGDASLPLSLGGLLATFLGWTMANGALMRLALRPNGSADPAFAVGPLGFQWGVQEWRVIWASILQGLSLLPAVIWFFVCYSLIGGEIGMIAGGLGAVAIAAFIGCRVVLAVPASLDKRSTQLAFDLTGRVFWKLLGTLVLAVVAFLALAMALGVVLALVSGNGVAGFSLEGEGDVAGEVAGALTQAAMLPFWVGLLAHVYLAVTGGRTAEVDELIEVF